MRDMGEFSEVPLPPFPPQQRDMRRQAAWPCPPDRQKQGLHRL